MIFFNATTLLALQKFIIKSTNSYPILILLIFVQNSYLFNGTYLFHCCYSFLLLCFSYFFYNLFFTSDFLQILLKLQQHPIDALIKFQSQGVAIMTCLKWFHISNLFLKNSLNCFQAWWYYKISYQLMLPNLEILDLSH